MNGPCNIQTAEAVTEYVHLFHINLVTVTRINNERSTLVRYFASQVSNFTNMSDQ
jgi:hypothetical protein